MRRAIAIGAAVAAAAMLPAASAMAKTDNPRQLAAKQCTAEQKADRQAFRATYGKPAMRNCIRQHRGEAEETLTNASRECRAEREADPAAFQETYGTTDGQGKGAKRNAFGRCVSQKARAKVRQEVREFKNAAQECRAEREADPAAFQETYGTNEGQGQGAKRNAFGKCVSSKVKEQDETEDGTEG